MVGASGCGSAGGSGSTRAMSTTGGASTTTGTGGDGIGDGVDAGNATPVATITATKVRQCVFTAGEDRQREGHARRRVSARDGGVERMANAPGVGEAPL